MREKGVERKEGCTMRDADVRSMLVLTSHMELNSCIPAFHEQQLHTQSGQHL